ncbi:hypothetical protein C7450_11499 [Chelatococcus asaccharovorans]|uniref:Uncharacterized protein n=1 Tax=Chelatococcus asaccharovorans TaxID=28210 RepID=A0A2V3TXF3_9HYPH|nr:hypothetical protein C7450_11499 [Chelatococcus asaccharovorans]
MSAIIGTSYRGADGASGSPGSSSADRARLRIPAFRTPKDASTGMTASFGEG